MTGPVSPQRKPCVLKVEQGAKVAWCARGLSARQPFRDGGHNRR